MEDTDKCHGKGGGNLCASLHPVGLGIRVAFEGRWVSRAACDNTKDLMNNTDGWNKEDF